MSAIVTRGLTKVFDGKPAVDRLSLTVEEGEFFGFVGRNGAGKTTTLRMLTGSAAPSAGTAHVAGLDVVADPLGVKARIGVLPDSLRAHERLSGREWLELCGRLHGGERGAVAARAERLLDLLDLDPASRDRELRTYSLGMRKKVGICAALIHRPRVLFLDEPFSGLDPVTAGLLRDVLAHLVERGVTVFHTSHVLDVVERLSSRVGILDGGVLIAVGSLPDLRERAALAPDATLVDVFARLVGGQATRGDLSWLD